MKKFLFFLPLLFLFSNTFASDSPVMDIYTGSGTPCQLNNSYAYDVGSLQYACVVEKKGGESVLNLNGKENNAYTGVESVAFGNSGTLILYLNKGKLYSILYGNYQSPWYPFTPSIQNDASGNFVITAEDSDGYLWIYNGKEVGIGLPQYPFVLSDTFNLPIVFESTSDKSWYDHVYLGDTEILTEYSHFIYEGTYLKKSKNTVVLLARKGEHTVLIALNEDFSVSKLAEVPYDLYEYALFAMNYDHPSQFAFVVKDRERYRIVSNGGRVSGLYDSVDSLSYDTGFGLFKQVTKGGKDYFSIGNIGYGPYDTVSYPLTTSNRVHWYITVSKGGKDYMVIDGREVAF